MNRVPHVVIVGGGFGGLNAARRLARHPVRVTLIDRENYHLFQPLLYQVATAALSPADIAVPIRSILRGARNVRVVLAEATAVDADAKQVRLADGSLVGYDYLILATGARHAYFGHPEWEGLAPGLKSIEDATEIRRRGLMALERAEREPDPAERAALLTFVVVGGGPTGVELAGAMAEVGRRTVARDFRMIDPRRERVLLLEGGPRILATFPEDLAREAHRALTALGVEVRTNARVTDVSEAGVKVGDEFIPARTVYWAAGVAPSPLVRTLGAPLDKAGHVLVEPDLTVPGHPEVYAIGDVATFLHQTGRPLPGVAQVAIQQGKAAADNVWRSVQGRPRARFRYRDLGNLATIGRGAAIADLGRIHLSGFIAWLFWSGVHIYNLIGFEQRLLVMLQWAWLYVTFRRAARLITNPWRPEVPEAPSPRRSLQ
jgi:NADH:ubiquinone reductase (H+-translocating)